MAKLIPIPFDRLLRRIFYEYKKTDSIFDLSAREFYRPGNEYDLSVKFLGKKAANPAGPAAGPHTQLAQNIVLAWLAGSRILELKTVQINDHLELTRPCIDMATIGYNTEWSQELSLDESLREYVKASMIIEILKQWMFLSDNSKRYERNQFDTIFDLSVGYDLSGIQSDKIRNWLHSMRNATSLIEEFRKQIPAEFSAYKDLHFNSEIGDSITLSTFHGTRAEEIESICEFLIAELDFNVVIKMNPPMLGRETLEHLLHDKLGYAHIEVNKSAYEASVTYNDAVELTRRLQVRAGKKGRIVGVKFGNTLEVINKGDFLKGKVQYMSGQPLHVLHLQLVNQWRKTFGGNVPISFSAGVDANNFADCVSLGLVPVTTCTDLLRPRGYGRLPHYLQNLELKMRATGSKNIEEFITRSSDLEGVDETAGFERAVMSNTSALLKRSIENPRYCYDHNRKAPRKIGSHLVFWDCLDCDKCLPVCPNDANFVFDVEPVDQKYFIVEVNENGWSKKEAGNFKIEEVEQLANFADACNECGNCDVFCPEAGGPYLEKPRFFGSLNSFRQYKDLSGFYLDIKQTKSTLVGRFKDGEFELSWDSIRDRYVFSDGSAAIETDSSTHEIRNASLLDSSNKVIDMQYYHAMSTLMKGMLNTSRVNFVNVDVHRDFGTT
jgi:putative selenate reductase